MPNGKPGDHPLTDILVHKTRVFSPEIDNPVMKLSSLMSSHELDNLITWLRPPPPRELEQRLREEYKTRLVDAKQRGWEVETSDSSED